MQNHPQNIINQEVAKWGVARQRTVDEEFEHRLKAPSSAGQPLMISRIKATGNLELLAFHLGSVKIGFAYVWSDGAILTLGDLVIRNSLRGRGYGRQALQLLAQAARSRKLKTIEVTLAGLDLEMIGFFRSAGFAPRSAVAGTRLELAL